MSDLKKRNTRTLIPDLTVAVRASKLGANFVLTFRDQGMSEEICKSRFVVKGHRNEMK